MGMKTSVAILALASIISPACHQNDSEIQESFVVDGQVWAHGAVQAALIGPPTILALVPTDPSSSGDAADQSLTNFKLVGVFDSHEINQKQHDVLLIDHSPTHPAQVLAMLYRLCVSQKPVYGGTDIVVSVQKVWDMPNPTDACKSRMTAIGRSFLATGNTVGTVKLEKTITMAEITGGAKTGSWGIALTDIQEVSQRQRIYCSGDSTVSQGAPGQNVSQSPVQGTVPGKSQGTNQSTNQSTTQQGAGAPGQSGGAGQTPTQGGSCGAPLPPADFCNGNPLGSDCVNALLAFPTGTAALPITASSGMKPVESLANVFQMPNIVGEPGVAKFVSKIIASGEGASEIRCESVFSAVARTVHHRVHRHCELTSSPVPPVDGKLACGVAIKIHPSAAVVDKVCEVIATFDSATPEAMAIRVFTSY